MKKKLGLMTHIIIYGVFGVGLVSLASLANSAPASATCTTDSTTGVVTCSESASATVHVAEACTMTATNNTPHTAEIANGLYSGGISEYSNGIGKTTLKVVCNDASGFSIYAVGYTNNEFGNTKLMTNAADANAPIINTGTYDSGNTSAWAMKVSPVTGTFAPISDNSFNSFHNIPNVYTRVAYRTSGTDMNSDPSLATGSSVETTYAAYVSPNQPAGTYVGKVKYTLVHPANETPIQPQTTESGKICYYPNAKDVEGTMGCQTVSASATSKTLLASNFSRGGYGFAGWSKTYDYSDPTGFLGPQEYIEFDAGTYAGNNNGLSLYAHWVKSEGTLQNWTCPNNTTMPIGTVKALTDQRDNETYAIAKLADSKCWMIENLRVADAHEESGNLVTTILTIANTNNPLNDGTDVTLKHNYTDTTTSNTLSPTSSVAYDADTAPDGWCTAYSAACLDQSRVRTDNTTNRATGNPTTNASSMYSYGNYYNWYSATAGRGTYSFSTNNNSVGGDLCPSGWRLPKGGDKTRVTSNNDNDFWTLIVAHLNSGILPANYDSLTDPYYSGAEASPVDKALRSYPNNYLYSGYIYGGSLNVQGSSGYYWSSTVRTVYAAYYLDFVSSRVSPGTTNNNKYIGRSVRCVAQ